MSGILYISYDGMLEPLGQSQVLAYLERLSGDRRIALISFEKPEHWAERATMAPRMRAAGIDWRPLRYHKRPSALATAYDIFQGIWHGVGLVRRHRLGIVHARSYVPSVMALAIKRLTGARYVFDMRGFWADERVDGGIWPRKSPLFRLAKWFERRFLLGADAVVSLTHAAARELRSFPYLAGRPPAITIIPTCADLERFHPPSAPPGGPFTLGYVGTVGNWYDFGVTARLFARLLTLRPDARFLIVNRGEHDFIRRQLAVAGVPEDRVEIHAASHAQVADHIRAMHAGILVARPAYSHVARAPTKLAEFLGCGVPCLVNAGVGDVEGHIEANRVGVVMRSEEEAEAALRALIELANSAEARARCVATAHREFSLGAGVDAYGEIYRGLERGR